MRKLARFVPPSLLARARELEALRQAFQSCIDHSLYRHCAPLHLDNGILYIGCDSAAWASRLRLLAATLSPRLASATGLTVQKIATVITPQAAVVAPERPHQLPRALHPETARHIESAAGSIHHDRLREALQRLARHIAEHTPEAD